MYKTIYKMILNRNVLTFMNNTRTFKNCYETNSTVQKMS